MAYQPPGSEKIRALVEPYIKQGTYPRTRTLSEAEVSALDFDMALLLVSFCKLLKVERALAIGDVPTPNSRWANIRIRIRNKIWAILELDPAMLSVEPIQRHGIEKGAIPDPDPDESMMQYFRLPHWDFAHWACGTPVTAKRVLRSVHVKGMRGAGTGEVRADDVMWCPTCQKEPVSTPVYI